MQLCDSPVVEAFRFEFAHKLSLLAETNPEQLEELEETLMMMPDYELERIMIDMRAREEARHNEEMLLSI
jgi:hypothetical protein